MFKAVGKALPRVVKLSALDSSRSMSLFKFNTLNVSTPKEYVYKVQLNRPNKYNALSYEMWMEIGECFKALDDSADCRVVLLTGEGKGFCSGIDLMDAMKLGQDIAEHEDIARKANLLEKRIKQYQDAFLAIEKCRKPVITAIHGLCVGGGFNMICAADIRYCSKNAWFALAEVNLGLAADVGALQWLPRNIGSSSLVRELAFTGRKMLAEEALQNGFVNRLFEDDESLLAGALKLAEEISLKSPVAVQNTKKALVYSDGRTVQDGLDYIRNLNQAMLQSEDFLNTAVAMATKEKPPTYSKL